MQTNQNPNTPKGKFQYKFITLKFTSYLIALFKNLKLMFLGEECDIDTLISVFISYLY